MDELDVQQAEQDVMGFTEQYASEVIGTTTDVESPEARRAGFAEERKVGRKLAIENLNRMTDRQKLGLAYDMFVNVPGAYASFADITGDDGEINPDTFINAWETTFQYALKAGPEGMNFTTKYFDILMRDAGVNRVMSDSEFDYLMREAEVAAGELVDPANTNQLLTSRLPTLLGRRPTVLDQRRFFAFMQDEGVRRPQATDMALVDEFIMDADPTLSQEFDVRKRTVAERGVMAAIGIGG